MFVGYLHSLRVLQNQMVRELTGEDNRSSAGSKYDK